MWRLRAPRARRKPISRMRSSTETSMMFITPTPADAEGQSADKGEQNLQADGQGRR